MDADEEFLFRICVNRRVLRASPDSVAAGCAVPEGTEGNEENEVMICNFQDHPIPMTSLLDSLRSLLLN
jgi:hypothetical protein